MGVLIRSCHLYFEATEKRSPYATVLALLGYQWPVLLRRRVVVSLKGAAPQWPWLRLALVLLIAVFTVSPWNRTVNLRFLARWPLNRRADRLKGHRRMSVPLPY